MRQVAGTLRLDLAQFRELAAFAQFGVRPGQGHPGPADARRARARILRQPQFAPLSVENQVAIIWTGTNGWLDDVDSSRLGEFETGFYRFLESTHKDLLPAIAKEKALSDELTKQLEAAVKEYREQSGFGKADESGKAEVAKPAEPAKAEARPAEPAKAEAKSDASDAPAKKATPRKNRPRSLTRRPRARRGQPEGDPPPDRLGPQHPADHPCHGAGRRVPHEAGAGGGPGLPPVRRRAALGAEPRDGGDRREVDPLLARRPVRKLGLIVMTTDRGLAGALNSNTIRAGCGTSPTPAGETATAESRSRHHRRAQGSDQLRRDGCPTPRTSRALAIDRAVPTSLPSRGWWPRTSWPAMDEIAVVYPRYVSTLTQAPR